MNKKLTKEYFRSHTVREIVNETGLTTWQVVKIKSKNKWVTGNRWEIKHRYEGIEKIAKGMTVPELAKHYGCSEMAIRIVCYRFGIEFKKISLAKKRGHSKGPVPLIEYNDENVAYFKSHTAKEIQKHYGVSYTTVWRWAKINKVSFKKEREPRVFTEDMISMSVDEICKLTGRPERQVRKFLQDKGVLKPTKTIGKCENTEKFKKFCKTHNVRQIMEKTGASRSAVSNWLRHNNIDYVKMPSGRKKEKKEAANA